MDVLLVTEVLARIAPSLGDELRLARVGEPAPGEGDALDRALRASLARLRYDLNQQTFEFLKHKVLVARGNAERAAASLRATSEAQRRWRVPESSPLPNDAAIAPVNELPQVWAEHQRFTRIETSIRSRLAGVLAALDHDDRHELVERMALLQLRYELLDEARRGER